MITVFTAFAMHFNMVPCAGFEPATNALSRRCSTPELTRQLTQQIFNEQYDINAFVYIMFLLYDQRVFVSTTFCIILKTLHFCCLRSVFKHFTRRHVLIL